ncbi:hypothetical protein CEP51_011085 [Fusarium floridanum]|uniref:Extracellular membrane protein CFEM domain-containing protein n=1 Tax=Fusarium floridanum TaxID=1325733 RepID=A0A428RCH7_9HYPO|nr:hypothetical protein CEP51_011085 [Fusarium floridanum]
MRFVSALALLATTSSQVDAAHQNLVARYDPDLARRLDCRYPEILNECLASRELHAGQRDDNACYVAASCSSLNRRERASDGKREGEESGKDSHQRRRRQETESQESASQEAGTTDNASSSAADAVTTTEEPASSSAETEVTTTQESTAASASTEATVISSTQASSQSSSTLASSTVQSSTSSTESETTTEVGASCFSTTIKTTTVCPVESASGQVSTLECYSTNVTSSACSPGLLCATESTHGYNICMEMQNEVGLAGKIIGGCFGLAIAVCAGTLATLIYQDKRKQRELQELMEARRLLKERR